MLIVGEKINAVRRSVVAAIERRDAEFFRKEAVRQVEAGADVVDINAGSDPQREADNMRWLVEVVQEAVRAPLCVDSPNPDVIKAGFGAYRGPARLWANSFTAQKARVEGVLPLVKDHGGPVVGLCMDEEGIPTTARARLKVAQRLAEQVDRYGIPRKSLYLDPLVEPVAVLPGRAAVVLDLIRMIKSSLEGVRTLICLSAVSHGLPNRKLLNRTFMVMLIEAGIDCVILDPLDRELRATITASRALLNQDEHCLDYIAAFRQDALGGKQRAGEEG